MRMMGMILAAFTGQATAQTLPAPMQPTSQWSLEYAKNACVLSRTYANGAEQITLGLRPMPLTQTADLFIVAPDRQARSRRQGIATVVAGPDTKPIMPKFTSFVRAKQTNRISTMIIDRDSLEGMTASGQVSMSFAGKPALLFVVGGLKNARAALDACGVDLLKSWGISPEQKMAVVTPAVPKDEGWLRADDYPIDPLLNGEEGVTTILWKIGVDGTTSDCRVIGSSGSDELDRTACAAILQRARYIPARDKDNNPIADYRARRIKWINDN